MQANNGSESTKNKDNNVDASSSGLNKGGGSGRGQHFAPQQPHLFQEIPGQQWVAIHYPAATAGMVMQHGMMAPSHYMPYHPHQPTSPQHSSSNGENRTIWVGDLLNWMDQDYLRNCFASTGEVAAIKVIRNKQTGSSEGYGFVEFYTHAAAEKVLQSYSCLTMPNTDQLFRLNWASFSMGDKRSSNGSDLSIFVGDLAADVTDTLLHETFISKFPSVKAAKVVIDANTGRSKGYGFVRFGYDNERSQAMIEMNGVYCSSRPMRIGAATPRKASGGHSNGVSAPGSQSNGDSENTTIFVGGLDPNASDDDLRLSFSQYGEIVSVKIPAGKGCGFVQFANRNNAEEAMQKLNGTPIGQQTVRLSWGRSPANKQSRSDYGNQWSGAYYRGPFFDGSGYVADPTMYVYGGTPYPMYGFGAHQQHVS